MTGPAALRSALYAGEVMHRRMRPKPHHLRYGVVSALIDLDELPALDARFRLFGYNRRALFSFYDRDHGDRSGAPLRQWVEARLASAGLDADGGTIRMLCYPRILGFAFNPLTVYFCHDRDDRLIALLYEVSNTHGEKHTYVIPVAPSGGPVRQACDKRFFVSPFIAMDCRYRFRVLPPDEKTIVAITQGDAEGPLLAAVFSGERQELSDRRLAITFARQPLMTFKIVAAIHWEALKLWWKGVPVFTHSKARRPVDATVVPAPVPQG
ncbi:DUF1365 domain-containing protein [Phreatobacter sp.]|uniref:DUF1365 domain-containing protein n=1 Tax=Phreatobacter sp. TaxID=1966341 RepID=UPI003F716075